MYVPEAGGPRRPLVVVLHGKGGTGEWAVGETGWDRLADRAGCVVALPDAQAVDPAKPPKFLTNPQVWNDRQPPDRTGRADDVSFLAALIDSLVGPWGIDERRVYVTGFSNGAAMAFRFASERADVVAAVAPVAGHWWLHGTTPARSVPTLYLIGERDPLVPPGGGMVRSPWGVRDVKPAVGDTLGRWAVANGCDPLPRPAGVRDGVAYTEYATPAGATVVTCGLIPGLGHHWPGGNGGLGETLGGPTASPIDGTDAVWAFFRRHALDDR